MEDNNDGLIIMNNCFILLDPFTSFFLWALAQLYQHEIPNLPHFWENAENTTSKKGKFYVFSNIKSGQGIKKAVDSALEKINQNSWLLSILAISFQRYFYSLEQMAICWRKSPSSSMHVVEASESSFSDSAGVLREVGSWLLGEIPAKGNQ